MVNRNKIIMILVECVFEDSLEKHSTQFNCCKNSIKVTLLSQIKTTALVRTGLISRDPPSLAEPTRSPWGTFLVSPT